MIQVQQITKSYGPQVLFDEASFTLAPGERLGLVGRNGHGKTTLFRLLLGKEHLDGGNIVIPADYLLGTVSQHLHFTAPTVLTEACEHLPGGADGEHAYRAKAILNGLGLDETRWQQSPLELSGGFQVRLNFAKLLVNEPNLLLLDEPTNYLDIVATRWLMRFLQSWPRELILITHDRNFMDRVTTHTLAIHRCQFRKLPGSTTKLYAQIAQDEEIHERTRENQLKHRKHTERFIERFRAKASKARAVQSRIKSLDRQGLLNELGQENSLSFQFRAAPFDGDFLLRAHGLTFGFDRKTEPLFADINLNIGPHERLAIIGKNGKGKTTLLNVLAGEFAPWSGSIWRSEHEKLGYFGQTNVERLHPNWTIEEEILSVHPEHNRTAARNICGLMMFSGDLALKTIEVLSGGERSRVLLGKVLTAPANLLLLDEPTNHLDVESQEAFTTAVQQFPGAVVFVTHDEEILRRCAKRLLIFDRNKTSIFDGSYDEFLERVGWGDEVEQSQNDKSNDKATRPSKRELRQQRAAELKLRKQILGPLEERVMQLEEQILTREAEVQTINQNLLEITRDGFSDEAAKLSRALHNLQQKLDALYEEHQQAETEFAAAQTKFQASLTPTT